jgi:hypothetical protein
MTWRDLPASVSEQYMHQVRLFQARMGRFAWIGWIFVSGFSFSALGLVASLARFREEGSQIVKP